jgi:hypothetical protein
MKGFDEEGPEIKSQYCGTPEGAMKGAQIK